MSLNLSGTNQGEPNARPLAELHLNNRLYMLVKQQCKANRTGLVFEVLYLPIQIAIFQHLDIQPHLYLNYFNFSCLLFNLIQFPKYFNFYLLSFAFRCQAYGGRPVPKFVWYIDNNSNDNLYGQEGFQVRKKERKKERYIERYKDRKKERGLEQLSSRGLRFKS